MIFFRFWSTARGAARTAYPTILLPHRSVASSTAAALLKEKKKTPGLYL